MPRARNIKPAFFKNEDLAELDFAGRLLFIGLWCLADRNGLLEYRPKRIKVELFPYDNNLDINGYITVMERLQLIQLLTDDKTEWIYIPTFAKHQHPHHTEKTAYPDPNTLKNKRNGEITVTQPLCNGYDPAESLILNPESGILNPESLTSSPTEKVQQQAVCPHQKIIDLYHSMLPTLPKVKSWTTTRKSHLKARWREYPELEDWETFFRIVAKSPFLMGEIQSGDRPPFLASLDWLIKPENFAKTIEGKYRAKT